MTERVPCDTQAQRADGVNAVRSGKATGIGACGAATGRLGAIVGRRLVRWASGVS